MNNWRASFVTVNWKFLLFADILHVERVVAVLIEQCRCTRGSWVVTASKCSSEYDGSEFIQTFIYVSKALRKFININKIRNSCSHYHKITALSHPKSIWIYFPLSRCASLSFKLWLHYILHNADWQTLHSLEQQSDESFKLNAMELFSQTPTESSCDFTMSWSNIAKNVERSWSWQSENYQWLCCLSTFRRHVTDEKLLQINI